MFALRAQLFAVNSWDAMKFRSFHGLGGVEFLSANAFSPDAHLRLVRIHTEGGGDEDSLALAAN